MNNSIIYNILIVEDSFLNAQFIEQVVNKLRHKVIGNVKNASDSLSIAKEHKIDFVFMDINIDGDIDGIQCSILLNQIQFIPTIYMTAFNDSNTIDEATDTNVYGYLIKPFNEKDIEATLSVAVKNLKKETSSLNDSSLNLGDGYHYDIKSKKLYTKYELNIPLSKTLSKILYILSLHKNQTLHYENMVEYVWDNKIVSDSTVRDTILRLRQKIPSINIQAVSGIGYSLITSRD